MSKIKCKVCGLTADEHHNFEPDYESAKPKGCICNPWEFSNPAKLPVICENFSPFEDDAELCKNCEHERGCHKDAAAMPNIPSSATPQAGLEPRKWNGGEQ